MAGKKKCDFLAKIALFLWIFTKNFSQFFIDQRYQGQGIGTVACGVILKMMRDDGKYNRVVLCYVDGDDAARRLYEKFGFRLTGESDGDEIIMEMDLR